VVLPSGIFINKQPNQLYMTSSKGEQPSVTIVLLNWNGKQDTIECLASLKNIDYNNFRIVLVDNGSIDDSYEYFSKHYKDITVIRIEKNVGFTGGNNVGIKKALEMGTDYILMLNNDTIVDPDIVKELAKAAQEDPNVGIVGPKICYYSLPYIIWSAGGNYLPLFGRARTFGLNKEDTAEYNKKREVVWTTGCAMLIKREVIEKIGSLEEEYFSSYEDLDFCFKARAEGYKVLYAPKALLYHKVARDWGGLDNPMYLYYQVRNNLLFIRRNIRFPKNILSYGFFFFLSIPRRSLKLIRNGYSTRIRYIFHGVNDFLKKRYDKASFGYKRNKRDADKLAIGINTRYVQTKISGIGRYVLELMKGLLSIDKKSKYFFYQYSHYKIIKPIESQNAQYIIPKFQSEGRTARIFWEQFIFAKKIKDNKIDVFHGPSFMIPFFLDCPSIITVHDLTFLHYPKGFTFPTLLYYKTFFRYSLKKASMIIADSKATKQDLMKYCGMHPNKIKVIYLGVDNQFTIIDDKKRKESVVKKYMLPEFFFLFTGLLSPRKNVEGVIQAYAQLMKDEKNIQHKLVIVGNKGWLYEPIFELVKKLQIEDKVIFTGYVDTEDLPVFYNLAEALLFPSFYEGFGLPILEAMACGCPVITSNISSMPEVAGEAAILINPRNICEIQEGMKTIISDKEVKTRLIKRGLEQVKGFSWENTAKETLDLYKRVSNK
jgi:GT2 family glycosyltransferase/glycosyltransferase involved in cell wall biosynthesis